MRHATSSRAVNVELLEKRTFLTGVLAEVAAAGPPSKFVIPIGGTPQVDWAITAYTDRNPAVGVAVDYRGRGYTFDGSESLHFALDGYGSMDRGIDVFAAARGTVLEVHDGEFDRRHANVDPPPPDNYVLIDHGQGWLTRYGRLRNGSVSVSPGQVVTAGQKIGQVGGSGNRTVGLFEFGPVLDFKVTHNGEAIETFLDPTTYWQAPPPFAGDAPAVHYMATAESLPQNTAVGGWETNEHISTRHVFHPGERVFVLTVWHGLNAEAPRQYRYIRPDGTSVQDVANTTLADRPQAWRNGSILLNGANARLGTWQVAALLNGRELGRTSFLVAEPYEGLPEMKLYQDSTYVIDGRSTPIDFGTIDPGAGAPALSFTVVNHGTAPLDITDVTVPDGFSVQEAPDAVGGPGSGTLVIQLDDQTPGTRRGVVTIRNNDSDQGEFTFAVTGTVTGGPAPVVTAVHVSGSEWAESFKQFLPSAGIGSAEYGVAIMAGAAQGEELPWVNLNQVSVTFDRDVLIDATDLTIRGISVADYTLDPGAFSYDAASHTATWRLADGKVFGNDRISFAVDGASPHGVRTPAGASLDGDFRFAADFLPGDTTGDGIVLARDFADVKKKFFKDTTSPVEETDADYSPLHDIDGSGVILAFDFAEVKKRFFNSLPEPVAPVVSVAAGFMFTAPPVRDDLLGQRAEGVPL